MLEAPGEKGVIEKKVGFYRDCGGRRRQPRSTSGCAVAHVCAGPEDAPAAGFERRAELRPAVWSAPGGPASSWEPVGEAAPAASMAYLWG
ncbi:hypothetical protein J1605_020760 [Eschrichtius robustus]|uniref:Uncharacterized protein n=1 Tax=Eschrichtius robustus TaxID=9764 RepID=A0AB34HJ99_ESCRO|nr:hypothetical protein J1605_020760 [Eschrichtius robustus]